MSRLLNNNTYSDTCLQKLNADSFHRWFAESVNNILIDIRGLDLETMEVSILIFMFLYVCLQFIYSLFAIVLHFFVFS